MTAAAPDAPPDPGISRLTAEADAAVRRGDTAGAMTALRQAERAAPGDSAIKLQIAMCQRATGDLTGALETLDAALTLEPYLVVALVSKGFILEKLGRPRSAAAVYRNVLTIAPPDDALPPALAAPMARARAAVAEDDAALDAFMNEALAPALAGRPAPETRRFDQAADIFLGKKRLFARNPLMLDFPELPVIQFYDRDLFPWLPKLEAATEMMRAEAKAALDHGWDQFKPYVDTPAGAPVNNFDKLDKNPDWSTLHFWRDGRRDDAACALCPGTSDLLDELPLLDQPNFGPTAVFSVLKPHTHIPPHTGSVSTRLLCHMPLILPPDCRFRVGNETRPWKMGEAWVFDDTIEHEAWNDSGETRVILIFDIWNPFLSQAERELVSALLIAKNAYMTAEGGPGLSLGD